jgi:hypothetical protein
MNIIFVTDITPDTKHVSSIRVNEFANKFINDGNHVIYYTKENKKNKAEFSSEIFYKIQNYKLNKSNKFLTIYSPNKLTLIKIFYKNKYVPNFIRRIITGFLYIYYGGTEIGWIKGSRSIEKHLANGFKPDLVIAIFGNSSAMVIAQRLAFLAKCNWIVDFKDPWSKVIPRLTNFFVVQKLDNFSGYISLSNQHNNDAKKFFKNKKNTTIYSGFADNVIVQEPATIEYDILLIGSIYSKENLKLLFLKLKESSNTYLRVVYSGNDYKEVSDVLSKINGLELIITGYISEQEIYNIALKTRIICYVRHIGALYQHKLITLLTYKRPIICFPEESIEAIKISELIGNKILSSNSLSNISIMYKNIKKINIDIDYNKLSLFSWETQFKAYLKFINSVVKN